MLRPIRALAVGVILLGAIVSASIVQAFSAGVGTRFTTEATEHTEKYSKRVSRSLHRKAASESPFTGSGGTATGITEKHSLLARCARCARWFKLATEYWNVAFLAPFSPAQAGAPQTATIRTGGTLFRERCADCHGAEAKGDRGPDLTGLWTSEAADNRAFQIIRSGIPGSIMPPSQSTDEEIRAVVAYLRSISTTTAGAGSRGNTANGQRIFEASCAACHRVNDRGGRLGPELSRIASALTREVLTRSIRDASASIATGYEAVTLVTHDGQRIRGVRKGEDVFSIQIMDTRERLQGYVKADLRDVSRDAQSLMPDFGPDRLSDADLADLLDFLATLRASSPSRAGRP